MKKVIIPFFGLILLSCQRNDSDVQFKALEQSLSSSNLLITSANRIVYGEMVNKLRDPQTISRAKIWEPKIAEIKKNSAVTKIFIDSLKAELKKDSTNDSSVKKLFEESGMADELLSNLTNYKKELITTINPEEFSDNPVLQKDLLNYNNLLKNTILLDTESDKITNQNPAKIATRMSNYFENTSVAGALVMLEKIQNDVLNAENKLLNYINNLTIPSYHGFSQFSTLITQNTSCLKTGQTLEIHAGIGEFINMPKQKISFHGTSVPITNGMSTFSLVIDNKPGKYIIPVRVEFTKPDGSLMFNTENIEYTVTQ